MAVFNNLKEDYIFSNLDPYFSSGARKNLRYVSGECIHACLMEINPNGIEPVEYLNFAKADIRSEDVRGAINAIGNAKRTIHLLIDCFFEILGLHKAYGKLNFPDKLSIIEKLEGFPTRLIQSLNEKRNFVEHDYQAVDIKEAQDFIEITEMFFRLCYPFLKHMIIGIHVGLKNDSRDIEWLLHPYKSEISVSECQHSQSIDSPIGKIWYNFSDDEKDKKLLQVIKVKNDNLEVWIPYLNVFVYCTQKSMIPKNPPYDPKNHERLIYFSSRKTYHMP